MNDEFLLSSSRYKVETSGKSLPLLTNIDKGKYSVIVFENLNKYFRMSRWNRDLLDKYCRQYNVGIIGFITNSENNNSHKSEPPNLGERRQLDNLPVLVQSNWQIKDYQLNADSNIFRIVRPGSVSLGVVPEDNWSIFVLPPNSTSFSPIAQALPRDYMVKTYPNGYRYSSVNFAKANFTSHFEDYYANLLTTVFQVCSTRNFTLVERMFLF